MPGAGARTPGVFLTGTPRSFLGEKNMSYDYEVTVKIRNERILSAIRDAGYKNISEIATEMTNRNGKNDTYIRGRLYSLVGMKIPAVLMGGEWNPLVCDLCEILGVLPETLFTERQMKGVKKNSFVRTVDEEELLTLTAEYSSPDRLLIADDLSRTLTTALDTLTTREKTAIVKYYGLFDEGTHTLKEVGDLIGGVSQERARQIIAKGIRKLKHPKMSKILEKEMRPHALY